MAVPLGVQEFLRQANIAYTIFPHDPAYTAQEEAALAQIPGRGRYWAKTVVCFADGEPVQAVVPADRVVNLERLLPIAGSSAMRLARDEELDWLYPECERGAMPPFGPLFRQRVFVDATLAAVREVVFNAGTHVDAVCLSYADFAMLTDAVVGSFSERRPS